MKLDLHAKLDDAIGKGRNLFAERLIPIEARRTLPQSPAVYVFFDGGKAVHVGRCRKLRDRINGQCSGSLYSSSFAFKQTRRVMANLSGDASYLEASYTPKGSRKELFSRSDFRAEFARVIDWLRSIHMRYLSTADDVEQYLLELVVANDLGVSMDEFRTT